MDARADAEATIHSALRVSSYPPLNSSSRLRFFVGSFLMYCFCVAQKAQQWHGSNY
jgi:hypothetical protein